MKLAFHEITPFSTFVPFVSYLMGVAEYILIFLKKKAITHDPGDHEEVIHSGFAQIKLRMDPPP
jgi:hypothetical protein